MRNAGGLFGPLFYGPAPIAGRWRWRFDYSRDFANLDFRLHPELYQIGRGEQGVLSVEPYKSEILPHWRFKTPAIARESASAIQALFEQYRADGDFVGMDMARKFLQMGYTRSRRYANHKGGRKYAAGTGDPLTEPGDPLKAESAAIFRAVLDQVKADPEYLRLKAQHRAAHEPPASRKPR